MEAKPKAHLFAFAVLALFTFAFLGSEYHFDIAFGELAGSDAVVGAQAAILATSAVGLVGYSFVNRIAPARYRSILAAILGIACTALLIATQLTTNEQALLTHGCVLFLLLGALGNSAYFAVSLTHFASTALARLVGASYAAGLLLQFALHALAPNSIIEAGIIGCAIVALAFLLVARRSIIRRSSANRTEERNDQRVANEQLARKEALLILVCVVLMACVFSTLDNVVTVANAEGAFDLSTWPRLLLAASGIVAGFVFDLTHHRHSSFIMLCVTLLSLVSVLAIQVGGEALLGLVVFYLASGFFVVFFTTSFLRVAMSCANPSFWAGMGRASNNLCAAVVAMPSMALVSSGNALLVSTVGIVLLVAILISVYALENTRRAARRTAELEAAKLTALAIQPTQGSPTAHVDPTVSTASESPSAPAARTTTAVGANSAGRTAPTARPATAEKHRAAGAAEHIEAALPNTQPEAEQETPFAAFAKRYSLTPRERDVLAAVCSSEETLQCIADEMGISLRALQKHLTSIYRKSGTQSRAGLCAAAFTELK